MENQTYTPTSEPLQRAVEPFQRAVGAVQEQATRAAESTQRIVRQRPFVAMGISLGAGILFGMLAYKLFFDMPEPSFRERVGRRLSDWF